MITLNCFVCKKPFDVLPYRAKSARFCSLVCGGKWHMSNRKMPSNHMIGNTYRKGKRPTNAFTSEQVAGELNAKWVEPVCFKCAECGKSSSVKPWVIRQRKTRSGKMFCSLLCSRKHLRGVNHPNYCGGPTTYRGKCWPRARLLAVSRDGGICVDCKKYIGNSIPVHHIKPYREFPTPEEANRSGNLVSLCQSCHMKRESSFPLPLGHASRR